MDQETMDFKALRARFQEEELFLKQPKIKPAILEKPKFVPPPPQSPPHYLPAGARTSLLTAINQNLEAQTAGAPRVVFKEDKKESKKPLIQINSKGKDKSEGKLKKAKDKTTKGSKEKLEDYSADQKKEKRLPLLPGAPKESTAELVPAMPPPKATTPKKKGFLGFKRSSKRDSMVLPAEPFLDTPSPDVPGPAPLIPVPSDFSDAPSGAEIAQPKALQPKGLLPNIPTFPDSSAAVEITPPSTIPASLVFIPPPAFIPDIPAPKVPTPERKTPIELEAPTLAVSRPASQNEIIPDPPSAPPTPPPRRAISASPPAASTPSPSPPEPEIAAEAGIEAVNIAAVATPPPPVTDPASIPPSPKAERPISALSVLSRAEDMGPVKRMSACDQRIFNALEKARRKISPPTNPSPSYSITPPPKELPPSPTGSLPDLPPIDYNGKALPPKPVNGLDHVLKGVTEEGSDALPELLVVPPPPPKKVHPSPPSLGPAPEKPVRPPSVSLGAFIPPPPLEDNEILDPPEFSETDTTDVPEFDDVTSDAYSPEPRLSDWGNTGPDTPDEQNLPEFDSNGLTPPGAEAHAAPVSGDEYQDNPLPESSFPLSQESPPLAGLQAEVGNGVYESTDNLYEDITSSATKKKAKTDGGKKRKGPPKNPYGEAQQQTNEEKSKLGRFGKSEKKAAADGPDEKELKKKEKQRLEKEKKELKEKQEREKKEQKEREKKDNDMKKKFKITGQEEAMYQAKATVTTKGRKNDLPLNSGDILSIIRTTNCPKGKWLAKDSSNNYGYIAVDHVELDIKEMLELGKKAAITRKSGSNNVIEEEVTRTGSRASNHYPMSAESFSDDSEEWTADDDDPISPTSPTADPLAPMGHTRTLSMPDIGNKNLSVNHQHSQSDLSADGAHAQARHEALHKLTTFFHSPKPVEPAVSSTEPETSPVLVKEKAVSLSEPSLTQEMDFDQTDMPILPPPDLYA
ncbi:FYN-binding protein 1 isoform X2 [Sander lucioperca]|uniref:FYN-binding protein 1 isoform X2 n=1 Tax=Sander lucioperca TaxID=283035 RepID=UPI00125E95B8|nr:FYN-binding protein 1 isoform X2 [Sander lucioperca]